PDNDGIARGGHNKAYLFTDPYITLGYGFKFHSGRLNHWWKHVRLAVHQWHQHLDAQQFAKIETDDTESDHEDGESAEVRSSELFQSSASQLVLDTHEHMDIIFKRQLSSKWPEQERPPNDAAPYSGLTSTTARAQRSSTKRSSALVDSTDASIGLTHKRHQGSRPNAGESGQGSGSKRRRGAGSGTT
ncbi:hypothetical protein H0H87_004688, partial [Tephrocybe sp. NHM501043]